MMSESLTIRALPRCSQLFPKLEIQKSQIFNPDPFLPRARKAQLSAAGTLLALETCKTEQVCSTLCLRRGSPGS
jgi:hypothetical protein